MHKLRAKQTRYLIETREKGIGTPKCKLKIILFDVSMMKVNYCCVTIFRKDFTFVR